MTTKILVVDDEANVQRLLQYTLKQAGYSVVECRWQEERRAILAARA